MQGKHGGVPSDDREKAEAVNIKENDGHEGQRTKI